MFNRSKQGMNDCREKKANKTSVFCSYLHSELSTVFDFHSSKEFFDLDVWLQPLFETSSEVQANCYLERKKVDLNLKSQWCLMLMVES